MTGEALKVLEALYSARTREGFVELRPIRRKGGALKPEFLPTTDLRHVATRATQLRDSANVYFGVALRTQLAGGKDAVKELPAVWADIDSQDALANLESFPLAPTFTIASGSGDNLHAYWVLEQPATPETGEQLNRSIAAAISSDERVTDSARILRLPGTLNHKSSPPTEVALKQFGGLRYTREQIEEAVNGRSPGEEEPEPDALPLTPTELLLSQLDGVSGQGPQWQACCPGHDDEHPSLSIKEGDDGKPVLKCHKGCDYEQILDGLDDEMAAAIRRGRPGGGGAHDKLMALLAEEEVELFHDPQDHAYALVRVGAHEECLGVDSPDCRKWIRRAYYARYGKPVPKEALAAAIELISAQAQFDGPERPVYRRVGGDLERLCIDLGDPERHVAVVSKDGTWEVVQEAPVLFVREHGMLSLPTPDRGCSLDELRPLLNMADDRNWAIFRGCLLAAFHPTGPYFVLVISGRPGSGKSSQARYFARLVDPYQAQFIVGTPKPSDLIVAASRSWLVGLDNVSRITRDLSDVLCTLSTGAGDRKRALYTNADAYSLEAKRPSLLTSITRPTTRADLVDRSAPVTLDHLTGWVKESELDARFEQRRPRVFGAILDAIAGALRDMEATHVTALPRMADAAQFVTAAEATLGVPQGTFLTALAEAKGEALTETVHSSPFIEAVILLMAGRDSWSGTPSALLVAAAHAGPEQAKSRVWPNSAGAGTTQLEENSIALEEHGITAETRIREPGGSRERRTHLTKSP